MNAAAQIVVRSAKPDDAAVLGRLGALLVTLHHDFDSKRFIAPGPATERGYGGFLVSQIDRENVIIIVAELDGDVLGYAYGALEDADWMALRGPAGVIHDLVVDPGRRREGLGRALLKARFGRFWTAAHRAWCFQRLNRTTWPSAFSPARVFAPR